MRCWLTVLTIFFAVTPMVGAEPLDHRQLPAAAAWFVHVDLQAAQASTLASVLRDGLMKQPQASEALSKAKETLGIDPTRDIRSVTLYGTSFSPDRGILIFRGKVDQSRLVALLNKNSGHKMEVIDGHALYFWDEPSSHQDPDLHMPARTMTGAFFKEDTVVIGPDAPAVMAALDVLDAKAASLSRISPLAISPVPGTIVQAAAAGLAEAKGLPIQSPILKQCESGSMMLGEHEGEVFITGRVVTQSGETASQIKALLEGARAMAQLQATDNADLARLLQPLHVSADEKVVELNWTLSSRELIKLIEGRVSQRVGTTQPQAAQ